MPGPGVSRAEIKARFPKGSPTRKWKGKIPPELQEHPKTQVQARSKGTVTGHYLFGSKPSKAKKPHDVKMHGTHIRYSGR